MEMASKRIQGTPTAQKLSLKSSLIIPSLITDIPIAQGIAISETTLEAERILRYASSCLLTAKALVKNGSTAIPTVMVMVGGKLNKDEVEPM